ncbi:MAG TPA: imidazole glycerol phosphate synthase subunit HisH [Thermoanaerobaculia bacterium]|nr:imidazole glycerol phosphate synthase subunit HisH [Thermoanaerobaculia bacterium]
MSEIVVIDAGVGNLGNLARALERVGAPARITSDPAAVARSRRLVLPGVGAFRPPRERLRGGLEGALREALAQGAWLLGICIGFQLLFEESSEFGSTDGLGLLAGRVTSLPKGVELPHMGWNRLHDLADHPLLAGLPEGAYVYFVHSFAPEGVPDQERLAEATHGRTFAAVCGRGRVLGTQFHPEKSGERGLRLLRNYVEMSGEGRGTGAGSRGDQEAPARNRDSVETMHGSAPRH